MCAFYPWDTDGVVIFWRGIFARNHSVISADAREGSFYAFLRKLL
jgi:hypothetical protein